jgi:hypothetical protein
MKIKAVKSIRNEKGIALVMVLVLSMLSLAIMAGLIFMLVSGTKSSGLQKAYSTAQEAGRGGADVAYLYLAARGNPMLTGIPLTETSSTACLTAKLNSAATATNWAACSGGSFTTASSPVINPLVANTYDFSFQLGSAPFPTYTVYGKIVNTVEGNSGGDLGLTKSGVASSTGEVAVVSIPYIYTLEVDAENAGNRNERAKYSILYQY